MEIFRADALLRSNKSGRNANRGRTFWKQTLGVLLALAVSAMQLPAQTSLGTILGNVTDESGAAVPQVVVTIKNEGTSAARVVKTDENGTYTVPALPSGSYTIQAELTGFRTEIQTGVKLDVNQTLRLDLGLKVGDVTQSVEVNGIAATLQTDSSTVSTTVDNKKVVELPLNGRSFTQLTVLVPGAVGTGAPGFKLRGPPSPLAVFAARTTTTPWTA